VVEDASLSATLDLNKSKTWESRRSILEAFDECIMLGRMKELWGLASSKSCLLLTTLMKVVIIHSTWS